MVYISSRVNPGVAPQEDRPPWSPGGGFVGSTTTWDANKRGWWRQGTYPNAKPQFISWMDAPQVWREYALDTGMVERPKAIRGEVPPRKYATGFKPAEIWEGREDYTPTRYTGPSIKQKDEIPTPLYDDQKARGLDNPIYNPSVKPGPGNWIWDSKSRKWVYAEYKEPYGPTRNPEGPVVRPPPSPPKPPYADQTKPAEYRQATYRPLYSFPQAAQPSVSVTPAPLKKKYEKRGRPRYSRGV